METLNITSGDFSSSSTTGFDSWSFPEIVKTKVYKDSIEIIYKEYPLYTLTDYSSSPKPRVFKIIYSCKKGRWHESDKIYGNIIEPQDESYEF